LCEIVSLVEQTTPFSAGVEIGRDGGITCDDTFKAAEDVYVAGDIARFPLWLADGALSRIEHWVGSCLSAGRFDWVRQSCVGV
jgi:pyruvate/2-oxoglutarate dehydrogenase complex dihydrolipoamide dehydrogenase (E3) component